MKATEKSLPLTTPVPLPLGPLLPLQLPTARSPCTTPVQLMKATEKSLPLTTPVPLPLGPLLPLQLRMPSPQLQLHFAVELHCEISQSMAMRPSRGTRTRSKSGGRYG